jgi:hypothetical protein
MQIILCDGGSSANTIGGILAITGVNGGLPWT